ncbi:DUF1648 domain-containing protein [Porphyromonas macacae]|uniref:Predicted membrane protein n=1 Tax=Porphyromonas macacae TaxID=28115 RepID=A0A379DH30_9PORP|nr:DUF1648 domain-containing protein [Porphyromonas macacae]SUB77656.1 Predicted membrane protein [Porphyromonas macacae]
MKVKIVNICSTIVVLVTLFFFVAFYQKIPSLIPIHYGFNGEIDCWGSKDTLWYFVIGNIIINIFLGILTKYPQIYNYPFKVTDKNREKVYASASLFVAVLRLIVSLVVACVVLFMSLLVKKIPTFFYVCILSLPIISMLYGTIQLIKNK